MTGESQPRYPYNPDLFSVMPENVERILELGCNNGAFGKAYKERFPNAVYLGIEIDASLAVKAQTYLDSVVVGDCEDLAVVSQATHGTPVQCIVYGDVLEHLRDPWETLRLHVSHLAPQGVVVASIPNIQHWTTIFNLLQGRWEYQDSGLMDRTHLRFFTYASIQQLFQQSNLKIDLFNARRPTNDDFSKFFEVMRPVLARFGVDIHRFQQTANVVQYVVRAIKAM